MPGIAEIPENQVCRFTVLLEPEAGVSWKLVVYRYYYIQPYETIELVLTDSDLLSVYYDDSYLRGRSYFIEENMD